MTLYEILEVSEKASNEIIEKAYKTLAKKYHPDLQQNQNQKINASEKMKKINQAYDILSDATKRKEYDEKLNIERRRAEEERRLKETKQIELNQNRNLNYQINNLAYNQEKKQYYDNAQNSSVENWRDLLGQLTNRERRKVTKKIEKDAQKEYQKLYTDYMRSLGYRVKSRITLKSIISIIITILIIIIIGNIVWRIPVLHSYLLNIYNTNGIVKILVDIVRAVVRRYYFIYKTFI